MCKTLQLNGCFICITTPLGENCTAAESCIILAFYNFFLEKAYQIGTSTDMSVAHKNKF